jgi:hypothetical protein
MAFTEAVEHIAKCASGGGAGAKLLYHALFNED